MKENPLDILNNIKENIKNIDDTLSARLKKEIDENLKNEVSDDKFYNSAINNIGESISDFLISKSKADIAELLEEICLNVDETQDLVYELRKAVNKRDSGRSFFEKLQKEIVRSSKEELRGKIMPIFSKLSNKLKEIDEHLADINERIIPQECTVDEIKHIINEQLGILVSKENIEIIKNEILKFLESVISKFFKDLNIEISTMLSEIDKLSTTAYNNIQAEFININTERILNCIANIKSDINLFEKIQEKTNDAKLSDYRAIKGIRNSENISILINYDLSEFKEEQVKTFEEKTNTVIFDMSTVNEVAPEIIIYVSNIEDIDKNDIAPLTKIHKNIVNGDSKITNAIFVWAFYNLSDSKCDTCIDKIVSKLKENTNISEKKLEYYKNSCAIKMNSRNISIVNIFEAVNYALSSYYLNKLEKYIDLTKEIYEDKKDFNWQLLKSRTVNNKKVTANPVDLIQSILREIAKDKDIDYEQIKLKIEKQLGVKKLKRLVDELDVSKVPQELKDVLLLWIDDIDISIEEILKSSSKGSKVFFKPNKYKMDEMYFVKGIKEDLLENQNWKVSLYLIQAMILTIMYYNNDLNTYYLNDIQKDIGLKLKDDLNRLKSIVNLK